LYRFFLKFIGDARAQRLTASPLAQRFVRGTGWSMVGVLISRLSTLIGFFFAGHILGRELFGQYGMVQSTMTMFSGLAGFGLGVTATKYVAGHRVMDKQRAGEVAHACIRMAWLTGALITVILYFIAPWLAGKSIGAPELIVPLRISAASLMLGAVASAQHGILSGLEAFREIARVNIWSNTGAAIILVLGSWLFGLHGAVAGILLGSTITYFMQRLVLNKQVRAAGLELSSGSTIDWSVFWKFSLPAVLAGLMIGPANWICNAMLVNRNDGFIQMGTYNAASQYLTALLFVPIVMGQTVLPMLSERIGANDRMRSVKLMMVSIKINALAVWPAVLVGSIISPWLMRLYGPEFVDGWKTLIWCLINAGVLAVQVPAGQIMSAAGRMWAGFYMNMGWAIIFILLSFPMVRYGSEGLAFARLIAYVIHGAWTFVFAFKVARQIPSGSTGPDTVQTES